jgi:glycosyltransferase involved in cell wall biosynthesis
MAIAKKIRALFLRRYVGFSGGHAKVWDYFSHFIHMQEFDPKIYFTEDSIFDEENPWKSYPDRIVRKLDPFDCDFLFIGGRDWHEIAAWPGLEHQRPILNFIQSTRHAEPNYGLRDFLCRQAFRIACSEEVLSKIKGVDFLNGPVHLVENGIDKSRLPRAIPYDRKTLDVVILGYKNPTIAAHVHQNVLKIFNNARLINDFVPRSEVISAINESRLSVLIPTPREGKYTPPLEAMALESVVITSDVPGNRVVCRDGYNCLAGSYSIDGIMDCVNRFRDMNSIEISILIRNGLATVDKNGIESERERLKAILRGPFMDYVRSISSTK